MKKVTRALMIPAAAGAWCCSPATADWIDFVDETATRLIADPAIGEDDTQEKDYDWGDLNNNGWIDLVVMRKQPFTTTGRRVNVLLMNENGVLVDRSQLYARDSDVPGDDGFLTPTNDRDVRVIDVDNDGWLDLVTATTLSNGQPKHISYPRVYMNKGNDRGGAWLGFRFENARIPQFEGNAPDGFPHAPRFCAVAAGDVTGNGFADLYFSDYDDGLACGNCPDMTLDFSDRLLINDGTGHFTDESDQRMQSSWRASTFGNQAIIVDINDDGVNDVVRNSSLGPYHTAVIYNNPNNEGFFQSYQVVQESSTYFAMVGDLNKNGRLDIVIADDGTDMYRRNLGNLPNGQVNWSSNTFLPGPPGFRSNIVLADLNNSSWLDILIADLDVDLGSCAGGGNADIYRNNQNPPNITFTHNSGNIPSSATHRTFDLAVFDLTGNGWNDIIAGRCYGTNVLINQPTFGIDFFYPQGQPVRIDPEVSTDIQVSLEPHGQTLVPGTAEIHFSIDGGKFQSLSMSSLGGTLYSGSLPPVDCGSIVQYYISGQLNGGGTVTDPLDAPATLYSTVAAQDMQVTFADHIEGSVSNWTIESNPSLTGGEWEQAFPVGTICCGGSLASPNGDSSPGSSGQAFTTENCQQGQFPGQCNVQHGPTILTSPKIDLGGSNAVISYDRWFFCSTAADPTRADFLVTQVSNDDGKTWTTVHSTGSTTSAWQTASFLVSDHVEPTSSVRVRFVVQDINNDSITNAGIDNLIVDEFTCGGGPSNCPQDLNGDGVVSVGDMLQMLSAWGACPGCPEDLNGDGVVSVGDLLLLLGAWGSCPR